MGSIGEMYWGSGHFTQVNFWILADNGATSEKWADE